MSMKTYYQMSEEEIRQEVNQGSQPLTVDQAVSYTHLRELKKEVDRQMVLIVAQRVSTIMDADQIIVLDEGRIVGCGTHKELLKSCRIYHEIAASQLSEEELEYE